MVSSPSIDKRTRTIRSTERSNDYRAFRSNPVNLLDPMGLQATTGPTSRPAALGDATLGGGSATFNNGDYSVDANYSLSNLSSTHWPRNQYQVFTLIKIKARDQSKSCLSYYFIAYGETNTGIKGADRYDRASRGDRLDDPYVFAPGEQGQVNGGNAYGGNIRDLYDNSWDGKTKADAVFVDTPGTTTKPYSHWVVALIVASDRNDFSGNVPGSPTDTILGGVRYEWNVNNAGTVSGSIRAATSDEVDSVVSKSLFDPYKSKFLNP